MKNKQDAYEKLIEMSINDHYTTGNLSSEKLWPYWYSFIIRRYTSIPQEIYFVGKLEEYDCATMFFIAEEAQFYEDSFFGGSQFDPPLHISWLTYVISI